jgi:hypothetical protein
MTTLGELKAMAQAAAMSGGSRYQADDEADVSMNGAGGSRPSRNFLSNQMNQVNDRFSNQPHTMLDGTALGGSPPPVSYYPQATYPLMPPPPAGNYGAMGAYNSNRAIPVGYPPSPAQQYINGVAAAYPGMGGQVVPQQNFYDMGMVVPRQTPPAQTIEAVRGSIPLYGEFNKQPDFAGSVPNLKNAMANDVSIPMREGFHHRHQGYDNCGAFIRHVSSCPLCSRYMKCDNSMYTMMTVLLIILFLVIVYLLIKNRSM